MVNYWDRKTVLITGASGFLGQHVYKELQNRKTNSTIFMAPKHEEYNLMKREHVVEMLQEATSEGTGKTVIIHLAADVGGIGYNQKKPGSLFFNNAIMGMNLIDQAMRHGVHKILTVGTVCSYPSFTPIPFLERSLFNGYPEETNAPYGIAKRSLLVMGQAYRKQYKLNSIHVLLTNLYGPGDNFHPDSSHVIPAMIRKMKVAKENQNPLVELWGDGTPTREFLYVEDAADAILTAMEKYNEPEPLNIGSGESISIKGLARLIRSVSMYPGDLEWNNRKPNGQLRRQLNTERARIELGWEAETSLSTGLEETVSWFNKQEGFIDRGGRWRLD